jgi:hypothetical protein
MIPQVAIFSPPGAALGFAQRHSRLVTKWIPENPAPRVDFAPHVAAPGVLGVFSVVALRRMNNLRVSNAYTGYDSHPGHHSLTRPV